jgi:manganese/zinc/iron transport system substrate-binding protein
MTRNPDSHPGRRRGRGLALALGTLAAAALVSGCPTDRPGRTDVTGRKLRVTVTIGMIADTAKAVGGDRVEVATLMGPGVDPHLYKASEGDLRRLSEADLILYNGLNLEGKMGDIFVKMASRGRPTVAVTEAVDPKLLREPPEFAGHYDPHIWFDVSMWQQTIEPVVKALSALDPASRVAYEHNGAQYLDQLAQLHAYCQEQMATIPKQRRVLVTAHDAFGYFGRAYDIRVLGLQGISTSSEYGPRDIQRMVELIEGERIPAVFVESSVPRRSIEAVVEGCRARGHSVKIGGTLYSDAMGAAGTPEGTYPGMVRHNVEAIVAALR